MTYHFDPALEEVGQICSLPPVSRHYAGRLIFDHLPKTAGQAVNAWLRSELGEGCVTDNLIGQHRELICTHGGTFSVISGHVHFAPGEGLDPRYQYATVIREPIDRVISWLFFVLKNHEKDQLPELYEQCFEFIESDGEILGEELSGAISNHYVYHFANINNSISDDNEELFWNALQSIDSYDVVGIYENLQNFTNNLGFLIGIPVPEQLEQVNVTLCRPSIDNISPKLRERIIELNQLDLALYAAVRDRIEKRGQNRAPDRSAWVPMAPCQPRTHTTDHITVHHAEMLTSADVMQGEVMTFALDIAVHWEIAVMEAGIHIFDGQQRWAFGVNSTMLKKRYIGMKPGNYRLLHHVAARLPSGQYTAGFAFADAVTSPARELFWHDAMVAFTVVNNGESPGVGYSVCPARQTLSPSLPFSEPSQA